MTEPVPARRILLIGIGNTLRRDDGAGWLFAEHMATELRATGCQVHLELHHQLTPELALVAAEVRPTDIVFVDASVAVDVPSVSPLQAQAVAADTPHALSPATVMAIAARLYRITASGWLVQTPAIELGHGDALSDQARRALQDAPALARQLLALTISPESAGMVWTCS